MRKTLLLTAMAALVGIPSTNALAQLSAPIVESVWGGRILAIAGYAKSADTSRIFIATESANSIFYADVASTASPPNFGAFTVMPGVGSDDNYGSAIRALAAHSGSGRVYFNHPAGLMSSHPSDSDVDTLAVNRIDQVVIEDNTILFARGAELHFGSLDSDGDYTEAATSPRTLPTMSGPVQAIGIHPVDSTVYVFSAGGTPAIYKTSDTYLTLSSSSAWTDISPTGLPSPMHWQAFEIAPDSRLLMIGSNGPNKNVAFSDDESTWTSHATCVGGISGPDIRCSGDSSAYWVFSGNAYSSDKGESGTWSSFGRPNGFETHPNDGPVFVDPNNGQIVYMTTDQGFGASLDRGQGIFEINEGIEAVQVRGFDMTSDKNSAWLASKSGIRKVTNYLSTPVWTNAIFPTGDGSGYYSAEMTPSDTNAVFVGNVRVYRTLDGGNTWQRVLSPEQAPWNLPHVGTKVLAIEVCDYDEDIIFAGMEVQGPDEGGLFWSADGGDTWDQLLIESSTIGNDVDVFDIVFNVEGSDTVAYIGVNYDLASPQGRSIYRLTKNDSSWTVAQDMNSGTTSTGTALTVTIWDLHVSSTGDTLLAVGTDAGINHPVAYAKDLTDTGLWTPMPTSGFPFAPGKEATAVTMGIDTMYVAVDNEIYYLAPSSSSWELGYRYPNGYRINFLYFDDLLVGTGTGLYGHTGLNTATSVSDRPGQGPAAFELEQNYPNPFNPSTAIRYELANTGPVSLKVFDLLGREVAVLVDDIQSAGSHVVNFNGTDLRSGVYFYKLEAGGRAETRKMVLVK